MFVHVDLHVYCYELYCYYCWVLVLLSQKKRGKISDCLPCMWYIHLHTHTHIYLCIHEFTCKSLWIILSLSLIIINFVQKNKGQNLGLSTKHVTHTLSHTHTHTYMCIHEFTCKAIWIILSLSLILMNFVHTKKRQICLTCVFIHTLSL